MALDAAGGQSTKYDEVAGIYVANNNQNVVINADNINFENNGYNRGYGIWTGASATNSQITINGNTNFSGFGFCDRSLCYSSRSWQHCYQRRYEY